MVQTMQGKDKSTLRNFQQTMSQYRDNLMKSNVDIPPSEFRESELNILDFFGSPEEVQASTFRGRSESILDMYTHGAHGDLASLLEDGRDSMLEALSKDLKDPEKK